MSKFVVDCMSTNPVMVGPNYPARLALADARRCRVRHVLVTDGLSYGFASRRALRAAGDGPVWTAVRAACATLSDQATLDEAEARMDASNADCLPILGWDGTLRGVVTRGDIRRTRLEMSEAGASELSERCAACGATEELEVGGGGVAFCAECLAQVRPPESAWDELYFVVGGQG